MIDFNREAGDSTTLDLNGRYVFVVTRSFFLDAGSSQRLVSRPHASWFFKL